MLGSKASLLLCLTAFASVNVAIGTPLEPTTCDKDRDKDGDSECLRKQEAWCQTTSGDYPGDSDHAWCCSSFAKMKDRTYISANDCNSLPLSDESAKVVCKSCFSTRTKGDPEKVGYILTGSVVMVWPRETDNYSEKADAFVELATGSEPNKGKALQALREIIASTLYEEGVEAGMVQIIEVKKNPDQRWYHLGLGSDGTYCGVKYKISLFGYSEDQASSVVDATRKKFVNDGRANHGTLQVAWNEKMTELGLEHATLKPPHDVKGPSKSKFEAPEVTKARAHVITSDMKLTFPKMQAELFAKLGNGLTAGEGLGAKIAELLGGESNEHIEKQSSKLRLALAEAILDINNMSEVQVQLTTFTLTDAEALDGHNVVKIEYEITLDKGGPAAAEKIVLDHGRDTVNTVNSFLKAAGLLFEATDAGPATGKPRVTAVSTRPDPDASSAETMRFSVVLTAVLGATLFFAESSKSI